MKTRQRLIGEMKEYLHYGLFQNEDISWCVEDPMFVSAVLVLYDVFQNIQKATQQFLCRSYIDASGMLDMISDRVTAIRIKKYRPDVFAELNKD